MKRYLIFFLLIFPVGINAQVIPQDSLALVALYDSTGGPGWINQDNWLSGQPVSTWWGVSVDTGRVTGISLIQNNLSGQIPAAIGDLNGLTSLFLHNNQLTGSIPPAIGDLTALKDLSLANNQFTGGIPDTLFGLTNLMMLDLQENLLSGVLSPGIGNLTNLTTLNLRNNGLAGNLPSEIGDLALNLTLLDLSRNAFSGQIPAEIGNLAALSFLGLEDNDLQGGIPTQIGDLGNLNFLELAGNDLTGGIPPSLGNLSALKKLGLSNNALDGQIPSQIWNLTGLEELWLGDNNLTGTIDAGVGNLDSLRFLYLYGNQLTGKIPGELWTLSELTELVIGGNSLDPDTLPAAINGLVKLNTLSLWGCNFSGTIPATIGDLANLTGLNLAQNNLTGTIPPEIWEFDLVSLDLSSNSLSGTLPPEIGQMDSLDWLGLYSNQLGGTLPTELGDLSNLSVLDVSQNQFTGPVPTSLGNLTGLEILHLRQNSLDGTIPAQLQNLTGLLQLTLNGNNFIDCPDLSPLTGLFQLEVQNNRLTFEDIEPNVGISGLQYAPQDSVGVTIDTAVVAGNALTLTVSVGGSANQYQWFKNEDPVTSVTTDPNHSIASFLPSDTGTYRCEITNSIATALTLHSRPVRVTQLTVPMFSNFNVDPSAPQEGTNVIISVQVTGVVSEIYLVYGRGSDSFDDGTMIPMTPDGSGVYSATATGPAVTAEGLWYKVIGTNDAGTEDSGTQSVSVAFDSSSASFFQSTGSFPNGLPTYGWNTFSVPYLFDGTISLTALFGEQDFDTKDGNPSNWRAVTFDGPSESFDDVTSLSDGVSYFVYQSAESPPQLDRDLASTRTSDLNFFGNQTLTPGWNLILWPYTFPTPVTWDGSSVGSVWELIDDSWLESSSLRPYGAYMVYNKTAANLLAQDVIFVDGLGLEKRPVTGKPEPAEPDWKIRFAIASGSKGDLNNCVGVSENAEAGIDSEDDVEPLDPGKSVKLFFQADGAEDVRLSADYRSVRADGNSWPMIIENRSGKDGVLLTWIAEDLPADIRAVLADLTKNRFLDLLAETEYAVATATASRFRVIAGSEEFVARETQKLKDLLPDKFALHRNYPNPFNPNTTIRFDVPGSAEVTLKVFNILGQEVATLIDGFVETGRYSILWDGRNRFGDHVASGVYFYVFRGSGFLMSRKMLLIR